MNTIVARDRVANDWVVLGLANTGREDVGLAGAYWLFQFQSPTAQVTCVYAFAGVGLGLGASLIPIDVAQPQNGARISGYRDFSAGDLDGAFGMVINVGAEFYNVSQLSPGTLRITASDWNFYPYFAYQPVPGPNSDLGIDASWVDGRWMLLSIRDLQTGQYSNAFTLNASKNSNARVA